MPGYKTPNTTDLSMYDELLHFTHDQSRDTITIAATTIDAGNTAEGTSVLRAGLILAKKTADGLFYPFNSLALDGLEDETSLVVLAQRVEMDGTNKAVVSCWREGSFKSAALIGADIASVDWTRVQRIRRF